jgi:tripartite-type tricarboxylate transporter receptor subunit TctC
MPVVKERLASEGAEIVASSPEEFSSHIRAELSKWAKVVKSAGIQPE